MQTGKKGKLRTGYTTGTCAAIAAKAALTMLLFDREVKKESILTPKGVQITAEIHDIRRMKESVSCAVKKDAGDDPDVTDGVLVYARVTLTRERGIIVDGGIGVGRVTKAGLSQRIGEAAINPVPRLMIEREIVELLEASSHTGGVSVILSVPEGVELAKKTFNPRLGIEGGISILGTSGIVEPMSTRALVETIEVELNVARANGADRVILTPGNYGEDFCKNELGILPEQTVVCSNFVGEAIDLAVEIDFSGILLVGHVGKFIKLAAGIMNTHSHVADARMEIFAAHAGLCGASSAVIREIMESVSTDEAIRIIKEAGIFESVMAGVLEKIRFHLTARSAGVSIAAILFSSMHGLLGMTEGAKEMLSVVSSPERMRK